MTSRNLLKRRVIFCEFKKCFRYDKSGKKNLCNRNNWCFLQIFCVFNLFLSVRRIYLAKILYLCNSSLQFLNWGKDMYDQIRGDILFTILYSAVATMALLTGCYLLFSKANAFATDITPPVRLHRWTGVFLVSIAHRRKRFLRTGKLSRQRLHVLLQQHQGERGQAYRNI